MDSSRFMHELSKNTNCVHNVRASGSEIYQLAQ